MDENTKNIVLIGMPGSGKSVIGYKVSKKLNMKYIDMDDYIEKDCGKKIAEIFEMGEEYFRDIESKCAEKLSLLEGYVISTGGGIIKRERNMICLKKSSTVIFINRPVKNIIRDIKTSTRPLLADGKDKLYSLYKERINLYKKYCDVEIKNVGKLAETVDKIYKLREPENRMKLIVINGPNINFLGIREPQMYGSSNYESLCNFIKQNAKTLNVDVEIYQSNSEGQIIDCIQNAYGKADGIIINPGAYTHYSIAIYDALQSVSMRAIEVHITNIYKREEFRHKSVTAPACIGQISGLGFWGYKFAMEALACTDVK